MLFFFSKVQNLTHFSINSTIRMRISGSQELIWEGFPRARYVKNPYDKCLFSLFSDKDTSEG